MGRKNSAARFYSQKFICHGNNPANIQAGQRKGEDGGRAFRCVRGERDLWAKQVGNDGRSRWEMEALAIKSPERSQHQFCISRIEKRLQVSKNCYEKVEALIVEHKKFMGRKIESSQCLGSN